MGEGHAEGSGEGDDASKRSGAAGEPPLLTE